MRVLVIETATPACSVALLDGTTVIDHARAVVGRGHAERLLPMIAGLIGGGRAAAIQVDVGPGSFTGIRVGVAAARALGFGWGIPVSGYTSLALIAHIACTRLAPAGPAGASSDVGRVAPGEAAASNAMTIDVAIEGGHGELFVASYAVGNSSASGLIDECLTPRSLPFDAAVAASSSDWVVGNAAARLVAARGWGRAAAIDADARAVAALPAALIARAPVPLYTRGADARPSQHADIMTLLP